MRFIFVKRSFNNLIGQDAACYKMRIHLFFHRRQRLTLQEMHLPTFATGIDDTATMNAGCSGWTMVSIDYPLLENFEIKAAQILSQANLKSFHGKDYKRKKHSSYVDFLKLIRLTLEAGEGFACCTLLGQDWKSEFDIFCETLVGGAFAKAGITDAVITDASKKIAAPMFTYQRIAANKCSGGSTLIQIDRHVFFDGLNSSDIQMHGHSFSSQLPLVSALKAYRDKQFPNAPQIELDDIVICNDEDSFLIQAADIIGNFATACVFRELGKNSNSNERKCSAFEEVFGDILELKNLPKAITLNGDDLALDDGAASFTFCIG